MQSVGFYVSRDWFLFFFFFNFYLFIFCWVGSSLLRMGSLVAESGGTLRCGVRASLVVEHGL